MTFIPLPLRIKNKLWSGLDIIVHCSPYCCIQVSWESSVDQFWPTQNICSWQVKSNEIMVCFKNWIFSPWAMIRWWYFCSSTRPHYRKKLRPHTPLIFRDKSKISWFQEIQKQMKNHYWHFVFYIALLSWFLETTWWCQVQHVRQSSNYSVISWLMCTMLCAFKMVSFFLYTMNLTLLSTHDWRQKYNA